ncbi:response regulator [Oleiharenicola sp. Vm1]|uniref:response regulator n=1 Tax=Oleiharenicola sp. Vm1 TaxID=3398393 RepID=UPI0039F5F287
MNKPTAPTELNAATARARVMIVEDEGLMREFFTRWVRELPRYEFAGAARSGEQALQQIDALRPDVLLVDFQLPGMDGLEFVQAARQVRPQLRALLVTTLVDPLTITRVQESGVEGYVEKDETTRSLAEALDAVTDGRRFFSEKFRDTLARERTKPAGLGKILTRREQQVLGHVLAGRANKEIADLLGLSVRTVECHRLNLMTKLEATNFAELVERARIHGWEGADS